METAPDTLENLWFRGYEYAGLYAPVVVVVNVRRNLIIASLKVVFLFFRTSHQWCRQLLPVQPVRSLACRRSRRNAPQVRPYASCCPCATCRSTMTLCIVRASLALLVRCATHGVSRGAETSSSSSEQCLLSQSNRLNSGHSGSAKPPLVD